MASTDSSAAQQNCPACGVAVDVSNEEPLAKIACPNCGEKFRVERAFDNFVVLETLGVGGMGSVYKARDTRLDRLVALKLLRKELSADPTERARLEHEARATAKVNHPHVVQVFSSGTDHEQFYLVMELVDHGSLDDFMAQQTRLPEAKVLQTGLQVAQGLKAAFEKKLIHRDIKPANILFADEATAKIGDFGLAVAAGATAEAQNEIWGTPYYVAPERLNNEPEDFRSDIFSLGATLFHAIAGKPPIEGESNSAAALREAKNKTAKLNLIAPDVSRETSRAIMRMLSPDPRLRFQSYDELIAALQRAHRRLTGEKVGGSGARLALIFGALAVLVAGALGAYFFLSKPKAAAVATANASPAELSVSIQRLYDEARGQLALGKYDSARNAFIRLGGEVQGKQPLLNWIRWHRGLASLLRGYTTQARQAFQEIESGGLYSTKTNDAELAHFFVETAHTMTAPAIVPGNVNVANEAKVPAGLALFLFAMKDWHQGDFADAGALLEKYSASQPPAAFGWANDYKPLAQKFLSDYRVAAEVLKPNEQKTAAGLTSRLAAVRAAQAKLQMKGPLADELKEREATFSRQLNEQQKVASATEAEARAKLLEAETPAWNAALANYRKQIALYDFGGALSAIKAAPVSERSLRDAQEFAEKKAQWLIDWKEQLIADLNSSGFPGPVTNALGVTTNASISHASADRLTLKIGPYGVSEIEWAKLPPKMLLAIASNFLAPGVPDLADRQWRSAIFAHESGQMEAARQLGEAAAKAKPDYAAELKQLESGG